MVQPDGTSGVPEYESGRYSVVRSEQLENAYLSMLAISAGIVTDVSLEQPENAAYLMLVTLFGIVTDVSLEHL